jgi:predicted SprT family Zn-dependent metalloprotease
MSTYAIADAIERLAKNFKEAVSEKNKIEREKLEFEREKFEFDKQQLKSTSGTLDYECKTFCNHDWRFECSLVNMTGCGERYRCAKCGDTKTVGIQAL